MKRSGVEWHGDAVAQAIEKLMLKRVMALVRRYQRIIQEMFREAKSGRVYGGETEVAFESGGKSVSFTANKGKRLGKGRKGQGVHQASAPGEAPARDTSALAKGVTHEVTRTADGWDARIGVSEESGRGSDVSNGRSVAEMLEFGTSTMEARPSWRPALERLKAEAEQILMSTGGDDAGS